MKSKLRWLLRPLALSILTTGLLVCAGCTSSSPTSSSSISAPMSDASNLLQQYHDTVAESNYILHALGGIDGTYTYTNSIDALCANYEDGYRLFEVDLSFTSDHQLVLAHSSNGNQWTEKDWEERLGQPYDPGHPLATLAEFQTFSIQGRFQATTFAQLLDFMETHNDMFVMIDIGGRNYDDTVDIYQAIVDTAGDKDSVREATLATPEQFISYCNENHILSYSVSAEVYTEEVATALHESNLIGYVFTINDKTEAERLLARTGTVVGTDFLRDNT